MSLAEENRAHVVPEAEAANNELERNFFATPENVAAVAAGVAHDVTAMLSTITAFAEFGLIGEIQTRPALLQILQTAEFGIRVTKNLLRFSRPKALAPTIFDVNKLVSDLEHSLRSLLGENVELGFRLHEDPLMVKADREEIEHVLVSLVLNGREAMPLGGSLSLECSLIASPELAASDSLDARKTYVRVDIRDTGLGIPANAIANLFAPSASTPESQSGLTLSRSYAIIRQHGGTITVNSLLGKGSTFSLYVPQADPEDVVMVNKH